MQICHRADATAAERRCVGGKQDLGRIVVERPLYQKPSMQQPEQGTAILQRRFSHPQEENSAFS